MKYIKPKLERGEERLPPITTNFAPPPAENPLFSKNKSTNNNLNNKKTNQSKEIVFISKNKND